MTRTAISWASEALMLLVAFVALAGILHTAGEDAKPRTIGAAAVVSPRLYATSEIRVIDGDTIEARIHLGWGVEFAPVSVRIYNLDTWESRNIDRNGVRVSAEEVAKGKLAAASLKELIGTNAVFVAPEGDGKRDSRGRLLGAVYVRTDSELIEVAGWMKSRGHQRVSTKPMAEIP